jgi:putative membrane protein
MTKMGTGLVLSLLVAMQVSAAPQNPADSQPTPPTPTSTQTTTPASPTELQPTPITTAPITAQPAASAAIDDSVRGFILEVAHGNFMEIDVARIALERASGADVKQFAQKMIDDHTASSEELTKLAAAKSITIPAQPDAAHHGAMEKAKADLAAKSGADFDREYMKRQESNHEKMLKLFEKAAEKSADVDVKAFAAKTVPTVRSHWEMARDWNMKMKDQKPMTE